MEKLCKAAGRFVAFMDDLLFPDRVRCLCCSCALGDDEEDGLCPNCAQALAGQAVRQEELTPFVELAPGLDSVHAAFPYEGQARMLILRLKFDCVRAAAVPLARAMLSLEGGEEEILVPVPTTKRRLRQRGFNQAQLLAQLLSDELGMTMIPALSREDDRAAQATLSAEARARNLRGCMRACADVRGKRVLLVDDVYTTGATASEAARALREAGAIGVSAFCAAASTGPLEGAGTRRDAS